MKAKSSDCMTHNLAYYPDNRPDESNLQSLKTTLDVHLCYDFLFLLCFPRSRLASRPTIPSLARSLARYLA